MGIRVGSILVAFFLSFVGFDSIAEVSNQKTPLVQIFCYGQLQGGNSPFVSIGEWEELVANLRFRRTEVPEELLDPIGVRENWESCLNEYKHDFEKGEFILGGIQYLESLKTQLPETKVRRDRYQHLWGEFIEALRKKLLSKNQLSQS